MMVKTKAGFTLVELLIVIAIIAILAAVVFVALDPAQRFADSRDSTRSSEVNSVLNAVLKYQVDNDGTLPTALVGATNDVNYIIGTDGVVDCSDCGAVATNATCLDLDNSGELIDQYLSNMPVDPQATDDSETRYYVSKSANGRITVGACDAENTVVEVTR